MVCILQLNKLCLEKSNHLDSKLMIARTGESYIHNFYFAASFVSFYDCLMVATGCRTRYSLNIRWSARAWLTSVEDCSKFAYYCDTKQRKSLVFISHGAVADSGRILTGLLQDAEACSSCSSSISGVVACFFKL